MEWILVIIAVVVIAALADWWHTISKGESLFLDKDDKD